VSSFTLVWPLVSATLSFVWTLLANAASLATSNVYVLLADCVTTAFFTVNVTGCCEFGIEALFAGCVGSGEVTDAVVAVLDEGDEGLLFEQATAAAAIAHTAAGRIRLNIFIESIFSQ
jgi:hypothetical protein